ncbi:MAG: NUDIX domain-containing protein [Streptosporangiaceae bacterium]
MDGNSFARCGRGHVHWGRYGAAGLLLYAEGHVLLQQRALWCNGGGTWGMFGGGRHSHEDAVTAALRETEEECSLDTSVVRIEGTVLEDHEGWGFTSVIGSTPKIVDVRGVSMETRAARWFPVPEVSDLRLFEPFGRAWPRVRELMTHVVLVVDAANVMGSRPDGWWRDRIGAAGRLRDSLAALDGLAIDPFDRCFPEIVLVVEGAAAPLTATPGVGVVAAPGSGDDMIVALVAAEPGVTHVVVTADRELRGRCEAVGATVHGPRWLTGQFLDDADDQSA